MRRCRDEFCKLGVAGGVLLSIIHECLPPLIIGHGPVAQKLAPCTCALPRTRMTGRYTLSLPAPGRMLREAIF